MADGQVRQARAPYSSDEERLRGKVERWLRTSYPGHRIIHELNLERGSQRLDLAAVSPDQIVIVEIKSDADVLDRLPAQLEAAVDVGDLVWLVAGVSMDTAILGSRSLDLPSCVGIRFEGEDDVSGAAVMVRPRRSFADPLPVWRQPPAARANWCDPRALARLLWVEEWSHALAMAGLPHKGNHATLCRRAVDTFSGAELKAWVCSALRARVFARADPPIEAKYGVGPLGWKRPAS